MFCYNCGKEIDDKAVVCVGCGVAVSKKSLPKKIEVENESNKVHTLVWAVPLLSIILSVLSFIFVIASFDVRVYEYSGYGFIIVDIWGIVAGSICSGFATFLGITASIICINKKQDLFRPLLSTFLSVASILFLALACIV